MIVNEAGWIVGIVPENDETVAIESVETVLGAKPHKAVAVLRAEPGGRAQRGGSFEMTGTHALYVLPSQCLNNSNIRKNNNYDSTQLVRNNRRAFDMQASRSHNILLYNTITGTHFFVIFFIFFLDSSS